MSITESDRLLDKLYNTAKLDVEHNGIKTLATQFLTVVDMIPGIVDEPARQGKYARKILKLYVDRLAELLT